jgi:hypothetical protein
MRYRFFYCWSMTPLRVERDRSYFEGWIRLDGIPNLGVRRS